MLLTFAVALEFYRWLADLLFFEKSIIHVEERTREMNIVLSIYPLRPSFLFLYIERFNISYILIFLRPGLEKHKARSEVFTCLSHTLSVAVQMLYVHI